MKQTPKGRRISVSAVVVTIVLLMMVFAILRIDLFPRDYATDGDIKTNEVELATVTKQLRDIEQRLNALPTYSGTTSDGASLIGCRTDSGDLFQPSELRIWEMQGADVANVSQTIAADLEGAGWHVEPADQFDSRRISVSANGWSADGSLYVGANEPFVGVEVRIRDAVPCRVLGEIK